MTQESSQTQQQAIEVVASETGFSPSAVSSMLQALVRGGGGMAQFDHSEFGGSGQWMRGGMTMISAMSDSALKRRVEALCERLVPVMSSAAAEPGAGSAAIARPADEQSWWPAELGRPNSAGGQNDLRYAYFAAAHRLAVDEAGRITLYDTGDHEIGGVAQQQSASRTLTFTSQRGPVDLATLRVVSPAAN